MIDRWKSNGWLSISREQHLIDPTHLLNAILILNRFSILIELGLGHIENQWMKYLSIYFWIFFFILIKCEFRFFERIWKIFEPMCRSQPTTSSCKAATERIISWSPLFSCATMTFVVFRTILALFNAPIVHASVGRCAWRYIPMATDLMHWKTAETISEN